MKYVYMLRCGKNHYKIGIATSVMSRIKTLQTSCPQKIEIVCATLAEDAESIEVGIHSFLSEKRLDGGTEWFELTPEEALDTLVMINKNPDVAGLSDAISARDTMAKRSSDLADISASLRNIASYIKQSEKEKERQKEKELVAKNIKPKPQAATLEEYVVKATEIFIREGRASTSLLQRRLSIGYSKAARILDIMEARGIVGPADGARSRELLKL